MSVDSRCLDGEKSAVGDVKPIGCLTAIERRIGRAKVNANPLADEILLVRMESLQDRFDGISQDGILRLRTAIVARPAIGTREFQMRRQ